MKTAVENALWRLTIGIACVAALSIPTFAVASPSDCSVTEPTITTPPPRDPEAPGYYDPLSRRPYYVSPDQVLWAMDWGQTYLEGHRKFFWLKPIGELSVNGQRLDGDSPPLGFHSSGYTGLSYAASYLEFPTTGCWEITAQSGDSVLRFVMYVADVSPYVPPDRGASTTKPSEKP